MAISQIPLEKNLLIVGPPDTGKARALRSLPIFEEALYIDLEDPLLLKELLTQPRFIQEILAEVNPGEWLTINHVDRIVKHWPLLISTLQKKKIFLAATTSTLIPFEVDLALFHVHTCSSLSWTRTKDSLDLGNILHYGLLPKVYNLEKSVDKVRYLKDYLQDFLDLEILARAQVRNLVPFHLFLPLAAESSGRKINYSSLAQDLGIDYKTVQNYFDLLISNHVGFFLKAFDQSLRKVQQQAPRFYFFDPGFHRAMGNKLDVPLTENSEEYTFLFKLFCINEIKKSNHSLKLSYLETKDGVSVDLIIERLDGSIDLIVFVTAPKILPKHIKHLKNIGISLPLARKICVTPSIHANLDDVLVLNYRDYLTQLDSSSTISIKG